jgi:YD repeat-containing protein
VDLTYDAVNRLTGINYSDPGTPDVTYAYDANSNRSSVADGTGTTTYSYDERDRLLSVTSPGPKTVGYRYDRDGNRTKLICPNTTTLLYPNPPGFLAILPDVSPR